jgi:hypothetical protein
VPLSACGSPAQAGGTADRSVFSTRKETFPACAAPHKLCSCLRSMSCVAAMDHFTSARPKTRGGVSNTIAVERCDGPEVDCRSNSSTVRNFQREPKPSAAKRFSKPVTAASG